MATVDEIVKRAAKQAYRRVEIKRVKTDGTYETDWFDITPFITSFGTIAESYSDNIIVGEYQIHTLTVSVDNSRRRFNAETDSQSIFFNFKTRIKTRFRIETGFIDAADNDSEVLGRRFYGIIYSEPVNSDNGRVNFAVASILKVFQLYPATGISTSPAIVSVVVDRLVKRVESATRIFDQFFEGASDPVRYQIQSGGTAITPIINDNETVWDKIKDYSLYAFFYPSVTNDGNFQWTDRTETGPTIFKFNGGNSFDNDFGINIVRINSEVPGVDQTWTRVTIEFDDDMFSTSSTSWTPGDGSTQDIYGERTFERTFKELTSGTSSTIATTIRTNTQTPKRRWNISTGFIPHLNLNDKVEINYTGDIITDGFILGLSVLAGPDVLGGSVGSINLQNVITKISGLSINLDTFATQFELTEV